MSPPTTPRCGVGGSPKFPKGFRLISNISIGGMASIEGSEISLLLNEAAIEASSIGS